MMRNVFLSILLLLALFADCGGKAQTVQAAAQTKAPPEQQPAAGKPLAPLQREFKLPLPIPVGEKLVYEVKYTRFPINAKVGEVTFEYLGPLADEAAPELKDLNIAFKPEPEERFFHLRGSAVSKGILIALLGVDVSNRYETLVDRRDFAARLHLREIKEGKKHQAMSGLFDRAEQTVNYKLTDLNNPQAPPKVKTLPRAEAMLDLLSAFYFVRLQKLKEGQLLRFPVSDEFENYTFDIIIGKKEKLKTDCGKLRTIKIQPLLLGPGQLISRPGEMFMWLTDDNAHIPVKLIAKTSAGTVSAKLLNFKKDCQIAEPSKEELQ